MSGWFGRLWCWAGKHESRREYSGEAEPFEYTTYLIDKPDEIAVRHATQRPYIERCARCGGDLRDGIEFDALTIPAASSAALDFQAGMKS